MVKKEKESLNPFIEEFQPNEKDLKSFENIFNNIPEVKLKELTKESLPDLITSNEDLTSDTFFKAVVDNLYSKKDISLKTEYVNEDENFSGAKLEFLTHQCGFHMGKQFLPIWEEKRVSLNRKSRQEIIMALWERQKEIIAEERRNEIKKQIDM